MGVVGMKFGRILLVWSLVASLLFALPLAGEAKRRDRKAPRIRAAEMVDSDGDLFADRLVLTYNEKVRHKKDADGRYPFTVEGYEITSVGRARGKKVTVLLEQALLPDGLESPNVIYKRVKKQPVRDRAGNQARKQTFRRTQSWLDAGGGGDTVTLTVEKAGTGDAQILSVPPGIDCGETCTAEFAPNTPVALNASTLIGSVTWSGCLDPTGLLPCTVIMDADKTVTATFSGP